LITARLARFYGWTEAHIDGMKYSRVVAFTKAIKKLEREENNRMLDFISFPHLTKESREKIIKHYFPNIHEYSKSDGKAMLLKYAKHVRHKGQEWPSPR